jgi:hypothetical protein
LCTAKKFTSSESSNNPEDAGTLTYLEDTASKAGAATRIVAIDKIGFAPRVDVSPEIWCLAAGLLDALDRIAMEDHPVQ